MKISQRVKRTLNWSQTKEVTFTTANRLDDVADNVNDHVVAANDSPLH
ncbi:hypothetical protein SH139x_004252 [Planctomycetaceae bacterium SH139]